MKLHSAGTGSSYDINVTDLDFFVETATGRIAYQMKRSVDALKPPSKINEWVRKVKSTLSPTPKITYVFPPEVYDELSNATAPATILMRELLENTAHVDNIKTIIQK